jgi:hypothetical protein
MANPTTNYSFAMPTNTDLVKDLPADFDIFGQAVDDRIKALNPETTAGDISYRSATANTNTRLGIGSTGQVLTVAGGVPTWAAAAGASNMAQIATGTLSGASVTVSSLTSYNELLIFMYSYTNSTSNGVPGIQLNATGNNHTVYGWAINLTDPIDYKNTLDPDAFYLADSAISRTQTTTVSVVKLTNCKQAGFTDADIHSTYFRGGGGGDTVASFKGIFTVSQAVSSIKMFNSGGDWSAGTYIVWGS